MGGLFREDGLKWTILSFWVCILGDLITELKKHQEEIVDAWVDYALSTYTSSRFFKKEQDKFANPVGGNIRESFTQLFASLVAGGDSATFIEPLEQFIIIRSVQQFSPSQALAPINAIKHIVRDIIGKDKERSHLVNELYDFEFSVDLAVLAGFDIYMKYRERLYQVRIDEIRSGSHLLTDSKCPSRLLDDDNKQDLVKVTGN